MLPENSGYSLPLVPSCLLLLLLSSPLLLCGEPQKPVPPAPPVRIPPALEEAKTRAQLLHTSFSGALSVMHRDFFRKNENRAIPSESLEDVFKVMEKEWNLSLRWLADDTTVMNVATGPGTRFRKRRC